MKTFRTFAAALGIVVATAFAPSASAAPMLRLIIDDLATPGDDVNLTSSTGMVVFNGGLGSWIVNVVTGLGDPILDPGEMDMSSVNVSSAGGGQLRLTLIQTGTGVGTGSSILDFLSSIGGTLGAGAGNSISFVASLDGTPGCAGTFTSSGAFANNCSFAASVADLSDITMSLSVLITHTNLAVTSFDNFGSLAVPEPGIVFLLGSGLLALAVARRRRSD